MSFALSNVMIGSGQGVSIKDSGVALSSLGGIITNTGTFTRNMNTVDETTSVAHGLGKTPLKINLTTTYADGATSRHFIGNSFGTYMPSTNSNISINSWNNQSSSTAASGGCFSSDTVISYIYKDSFGGMSCSITADDTYMYFTWTKTIYGGSGDILYLWDATASATINNGGSSSNVGGSYYQITSNLREISASSENVIYNHTLGVIPKWIEFNSYFYGVYFSGFAEINNYKNTEVFSAAGRGTTYSVRVGSSAPGANGQAGRVINATASNYTISWVKTGGPSGTGEEIYISKITG